MVINSPLTFRGAYKQLQPILGNKPQLPQRHRLLHLTLAQYRTIHQIKLIASARWSLTATVLSTVRLSWKIWLITWILQSHDPGWNQAWLVCQLLDLFLPASYKGEIRKDRSSHGGGVMITYKDTLAVVDLGRYPIGWCWNGLHGRRQN